jgi:hypothetical protein
MTGYGIAQAVGRTPGELRCQTRAGGRRGWRWTRLRCWPPTLRCATAGSRFLIWLPGDERSRAAGFDDHLPRPIGFDRLRALLQRFGPPPAG